MAQFLLDKGFNILLGVEPICYPSEFSKNRGTIANDQSVQISFWSKYLKERGFIFRIPRPLPENPDLINEFYDRLYVEITGRKAKIVLSKNDPFKEEKLKRGPVVEVPAFNFPSTTELFQSGLSC